MIPLENLQIVKIATKKKHNILKFLSQISANCPFFGFGFTTESHYTLLVQARKCCVGLSQEFRKDFLKDFIMSKYA